MVITWNELRDARERAGLTQEELAEQLGVSTRTITNWERVGVARKSEYKVERFFGEDLQRDESVPRIFAEVEYQKNREKLNLDERAEHDGLTFAGVLREASDAELIEELLRRARTRGLVAISKESYTPRQTNREGSMILRGERERLDRSDLDVGRTTQNEGSESQSDYGLATKKRSKNRGETD